MPITSLDGYIAAPKEMLPYIKTTARAIVALGWGSMFELAGLPGAGVLAIGNTANGIVPVQGQAGYPPIAAFGGGSDGHLSRVVFNCTVICRLTLFDRLFAAGAYAFNADVSLTAQPSFAARVPGGNNFNGLQLWAEQVTAATGNQAVNVFYTNQAGTTGRQTGATGTGSVHAVGRCWQLPLAAGDSGVQLVERVVGTVASAGTFNVMVLRPLWTGYIVAANVGDVHDLLRTGMIRVWRESALYLLVSPVGTSSGLPMIEVEVANG